MSSNGIRERLFFFSRQVLVQFSLIAMVIMGGGVVFLVLRPDIVEVAAGIVLTISGALLTVWAVTLGWLPAIKINTDRLWYRDHWLRLREMDLDTVDISVTAGGGMLGDGLILKGPDCPTRVRLPLAWFTKRDRAELLGALGATVAPDYGDSQADALHRLAVLGLFLPLLAPVAWMMSAAEMRKARRSGHASGRARSARSLGMIGTVELAALVAAVLIVLSWH